ETRVDKRIRKVDASPERCDEALDDEDDLVLRRELHCRTFEAALALDPYAAQSVHHHLAHAFVAQQRCERAEAEEPIVEEALELHELDGGRDDPLGGERVAERRLQHLAARPSVLCFAQTRDETAFDALLRRLGRHDVSMRSSSLRSS